MHDRFNKQALRNRVRLAREAIPAEERPRLSEAGCQRLLALPEMGRAHSVLGYGATDFEFDVSPALDALRERGARIALPRITGPSSLTLHIVESAEELERGPFGLLQPAENAPSIGADEVDLVIVPGVAFDPAGGRLGYGGGYYDRLLARMPLAARIGVAFDGQLVDSIPADSHDQPVDVVVTPTRTLRTHAR